MPEESEFLLSDEENADSSKENIYFSTLSQLSTKGQNLL